MKALITQFFPSVTYHLISNISSPRFFPAPPIYVRRIEWETKPQIKREREVKLHLCKFQVLDHSIIIIIIIIIIIKSYKQRFN